MKLALLALTLACLGVSAHAAPAGPLQSVPNGNTFAIDGLTYYGSSSYFIEANVSSDTAVLLASGSGYFFGIDNSAGSGSDYCNAFDSNTASGISIATYGKALSPRVFSGVAATVNTSTTVATVPITTYPGSAYGVYKVPSGSKRFKNGLVGIKTGSGLNNCVFSALLDSVIQATPQTH